MRKRRPKAQDAPNPRPEEILSEEELERIESDPSFRRMMKESAEDIRAGRYITHDEAIKRLQTGRLRAR